MSSITIINDLPRFVSPDEHKDLVVSTPASFSDIPPILRHQENNVAVVLDPPLESFTAEDGASGTLYIIESVLVFMSATGRGFQVAYPSITLHAISRADSGPSIYCQLDESVANDAGDSEELDQDATSLRELTLIPQNAAALESIFEAMSLCASLHPDPNMDEDDDDAFFDVDQSPFETFNGDEAEELSEVGRAALEHLESIIYNPFEGAHHSGVNGVNGTGEGPDEGQYSDIEETGPPP